MIELPAMGQKQEKAWEALLELSRDFPEGWTLVGGQMVYLHVAERNGLVSRSTNDGDVVLDVRAHSHILRDFTAALRDRDFVADTSPDGLQHRWVRGGVQIDVLIPRHLGERASSRPTISGKPTIAAPASQQALDRSEVVDVMLRNQLAGSITRPNIVGALVGKSAAFHEIMVQRNAERHLEDFGILASLVDPSDHDLFQNLSKLDASRLASASGAIRNKPHLKVQFDAALSSMMNTVRDANGVSLSVLPLPPKSAPIVSANGLCGRPVRGTGNPCRLRPLHMGQHRAA